MTESQQARPSALGALLTRELRVGRRIGGAVSMGVVFFLCLVTVTPFAVGPDQALLARIGPAILWIAALLATLLGLDRLFQADAEDGSLDLFLTSETPLELIVLSQMPGALAADRPAACRREPDLRPDAGARPRDWCASRSRCSQGRRR